ncbi:hypothetical protein C4D60_Mb02t19810 [Musa balbisiana]|uniref:Uncharacterized protein n=1 Tax=Musa balbisiana TaxID=52838 RepID=A0A4S8IC32_MUSBA|nr:hypothetical protein C4D60_Mb02t19810 [Musa balbisiana]
MVMFSIRAHCPTVECVPMMLPETHACFLMRVPRITVHLDNLTPASTTQPGPTDTSGPIKHPSPTTAVSCTNTFPTTCEPAASLLGDFFRRASSDLREDLLLDGGGPELDAVQDRGFQQVDARIDLVADEGLRLLHEPFHLSSFFVHDHDAVLGRLIHLPRTRRARMIDERSCRSSNHSYLGHQNCGFSTMCIVELDQLGKRVLADDVAVEDKEGLAGAIYQLVSRQSQRPSRSQWLSLLGAGTLMCADAMRSRSLQEKDELDMLMFESDTKKDMAIEMRLTESSSDLQSTSRSQS